MNILIILRTYAKPATVLILLLIILWMLFKSSGVEQTETRIIQSDIPSLLDRLRQDKTNLSPSNVNTNTKDQRETGDETGIEQETEKTKDDTEAESHTEDQRDTGEDQSDTDEEKPTVDQRDTDEDQSDTDDDKPTGDQMGTADDETDTLDTAQESLTEDEMDNDKQERPVGLRGNVKPSTDEESAGIERNAANNENTIFEKVIPVTNFYANKSGSYTFKFERYAIVEDVPNVITPNIDCSAIIKGDELAVETAKLYQRTVKRDVNLLEKLLTLTKSCDAFLKQRKYLLYPINQEEAEFPIAFSIVMYKDVFQVERLLRAIYRPQNLYCVHVDQKSSPVIHEIMNNIAGCFDNVFIASKVHDVKWGWFSVVKPELACMEDLLNHTKPWYYFVNTCGQEFPIKTNLELVKILKAFNGSNDVQGRRSDIISQVLTRIKYGFTKESGSGSKKYLKPEFPYNITWAKGAVHVAITRGFVNFIINTKIGQEFVKYINDTPHASEHMFNPLHLSPQLGVPGAYTGYPDIRHDPQQGISVIRYKIWADTPRKYKEWQCHGVWSRQICIMSLGDLHLVVKSGKLFVNKFHATYHPLAYDCLEEYVFNNTRLDIQGVNRLNLTYYEKLDFVKNHI